MTTPNGTLFSMMYEFETHDAPSGGTLEVEALSATKVFLVAKQWVGSTTLEFAFAVATENGSHHSAVTLVETVGVGHSIHEGP